MKRIILISAAVIVTTALVAIGLFVAGHDWVVEELMGEIHVGAESPWSRLNAQATAQPPEWSKLELIVSPFDEMCQALLGAKSAAIRDAADGYVDAVEKLKTSIDSRDLPAFQNASQALRKSCADCHAPGGVGGELPTRG